MGALREEWGRRAWVVALIALLLLGTGTRLYRLDGLSLWEDEIFTATRVPWPVPELVAWTAADVHPPLYYLILHGWISLGQNDWLLRWPSVAAGVLSLAAIYSLGRHLWGRTEGLVAMALLAVSPFALRYSQEARMHALFLFLSLASALCLVRGMQTGRRAWWASHALTTALNLYTIYFAFLVMAVQALWVGLVEISRSVASKSVNQCTDSRFTDLLNRFSARSAAHFFVASCLVALALYGPWWPAFLAFVGRNLPASTAQAVAGGGGRPVGAPGEFLLKALEQLGLGVGWASYGLAALFMIGLVAGWRSRQRPQALLVASWVIPPLLFPLLIRTEHSFYFRYLIFVVPLYLLGAGRGITALACWLNRWFGGLRPSPFWGPVLWWGASALLLALASAGPVGATYQLAKPDWRGVGRYLAAHVGASDVIGTGPLWDMRRFLAYYYQGTAELIPAAELAGLAERPEPLGREGGRIWWVTRFQPDLGQGYTSVAFPGLYVTVHDKLAPEARATAEEAIAILRQAVEKAPEWVARSTAEGVVTPDLDTTLAVAHLALGDGYRRIGRLAEAIDEYQAAVTALPGWLEGYLALATACAEAGRWQDAARAYERVLALQPEWVGPHARLARELAARQRWPEAVAEYQAAVQATAQEVVGDFLLPSAEALPASARPGKLVYGGRVRLLAYELDREAIQPGTRLTVTLYWQVLAPVRDDYYVFVHLFGRGAAPIGQVDAFPVAGRYPTSRWQAGDIVRDVYQVPVAGDAIAPAVARLDVGFYNPITLQTVPATDDTGHSAATAIARLKLVPSQWPAVTGKHPVNLNFGGVATLLGYDVNPLPGQVGVTVTLYWRPDKPMTKDYTVFLHLLNEKDEIKGQGDAPPVGGEYPTGWWAPGEVIADTHTISLSAATAAGTYRLAAGLYEPDSGVRLPVTGPGEHTADTGYLGWVNVVPR
jgi:tetratricopeptide (TPR) repeat protein